MIKNYDVAIIGFGRVGCPLGLSLEEAGLKVAGIDINDDLIYSIKEKIMPFHEPGYDEVLKKSKIEMFNPFTSQLPESSVYIITVGTPLMQHIETDLSQIISVINMLIQQKLIKGKLIVLRSTVAPGTTNRIKNYIEEATELKCGDDFFLAMCPERLAEGVAYEELKILPQIIGVQENDTKSYIAATTLFSKLGVELIPVTYIEAELAKLFSNIYRYINFSIPNYFTYIAHHFGVDIHSLLYTMKHGYPRNDGLKFPGFAAGTCLRKDFGMINECFPQTDIILQAYKINEYMPKFVADLIDIRGQRIGILGYTMKANTDDTRDSLTPKLIRYIQRESPKSIIINEPNFKICELYTDNENNYSFINHTIEEVLLNSDIIFIATNHKEYEHLQEFNLIGKIFIDLWNMCGDKLVNIY